VYVAKHGQKPGQKYYEKHREAKKRYSREYKAKRKKDIGDIEKAARGLDKL
jgi:hypothetical protein